MLKFTRNFHHKTLLMTQIVYLRMKHNRSRNIIWFNPPYTQNVNTNVAERFLNWLDHQFPKSNKLQKIFNRNTVKVSYSCNTYSIISSHNNKLIKNYAPDTNHATAELNHQPPPPPLNGQCQSQVGYNLQMHYFSISKPR